MRTNGNKRLLTAVKLALGTSLAATMVVGPVANAAEEEAAQLERVQVTGSRISRLDVEGATPVVTISREDLDNSGFSSVADFLRSNSFNSFGSIREESGNTAQGQATLNLRGLGSSRTLILIDGKRLPGSPVLDGQIQNLNTIPFAAVERIEILSDGASAVYGSDAIGGVVNVILRKDFEGGEVTVRGTDPDRNGGAERGVSVVSGFGGDRGRVTFALEADHRDTLLAKDRWFLANNLVDTNPLAVNSYSNLSFYGRNVVDYDDPATAGGFDGTFDAYPMIQGVPGGAEVCALYGEGFWPTVLQDTDYANDFGCYYDYTGVAASTTSLDRLSTFMDADYEINSDLTFNAQVLATRVKSWGRYAPAAAPVAWTGTTLQQRDVTIDGSTYTLNQVDPGDYLFFRWNNIGPARDTWQTDYQFDLQVGLEGFYEGIQWTTNYQYDQYDMQEWGAGYLHNLGVASLAAEGWDPVLRPDGWDPRHPNQAQYGEALATAAGNSNRQALNTMQRVDVGAQFDGPMMGSGPVLFFVGGEYIDQTYSDEVLAQMDAGNIGGSSGGSSGGHRSNWAAFGEASVPITDTFELNPAVRYDSYSDFGTNVSGKLSFRFQPMDYFVLRGSYGTGFRAPSLDELYQSAAFSASFADDLVACENAGTTLPDCIAATDGQYDTYIYSNPNLGAEESTQYLLGGVLDFNAMNGTNLVLSLDYYYTEVENVVTNITGQDVLWLEYLGQLSQFPALSVERAPTGRHLRSEVAPINYSSFDTSGIDFRVNYGMSLGGMGDLSFGYQLNYVMEFNSADVIVGPLVDQTGRFGIPDYRMNFDIAWTMGRHTVSLNSYYIPEMCDHTTLNPNFDATDFSSYYQECAEDGTPDVDAYLHTNIVYSFEAPWNARIQLGINNLTDEDPVLDSTTSTDLTLYPIVSRATYVSYTQRF